MSYTNLIKNTLDILDLNITFNENSLEKERIKGRICQVFSGTFVLMNLNQSNKSLLL